MSSSKIELEEAQQLVGELYPEIQALPMVDRAAAYKVLWSLHSRGGATSATGADVMRKLALMAGVSVSRGNTVIPKLIRVGLLGFDQNHVKHNPTDTIQLNRPPSGDSAKALRMLAGR